MTDGLPTPRTTLRARYARVLVWCKPAATRRTRDLSALMDADRLGPAPRGSPLPLGARDIVWRAVLPFRARDIERGSWSLLPVRCSYPCAVACTADKHCPR